MRSLALTRALKLNALARALTQYFHFGKKSKRKAIMMVRKACSSSSELLLPKGKQTSNWQKMPDKLCLALFI